MKNCPYCGAQIDDNALFCPGCGSAQSVPTQESFADTKAQANTNETYTGLTVLGFFFPLVALILYVMWNSTQPAKALAAGKGGLMSVSLGSPIIALVIYIVTKDNHPSIAKACGICGILSIFVSIGVWVLSIVLMLAGLGMSEMAAIALPLLI